MDDSENGKKLRNRIDAFYDVLTDAEEYIKKCSISDLIDGDQENDAMELIEIMKEKSNDLFYLIPIEIKKGGEKK